MFIFQTIFSNCFKL